ncbi:MAG: HAD family hydrolase [Lachnospiraceae bacterium]|nr:HAD family hydrolase [Lachnospiraceae bacterium]
MYQNYIFDLYGTLVDIRTNESLPSLWKHMAGIYTALGAAYTPKELKNTYKVLVKKETGLVCMQYADFPEPEIRNVFKALFTQKGITPTDTLIEYAAITFRVLSRKYICCYPGIIEMLTVIKEKGKKIYLLSNAQAAFTMPELHETGLYPFFDGILISSDAHVAKPNPAFMEQLLEQYHLQISESIMVGNDRTSDITIANLVGMDSLYIHSNISPAYPPDNPEDIPPLQKATYEVLDGNIKDMTDILLK